MRERGELCSVRRSGGAGWWLPWLPAGPQKHTTNLHGHAAYSSFSQLSATPVSKTPEEPTDTSCFNSANYLPEALKALHKYE